MSNWQLPANIRDYLAPETHWLEAKRRQILDGYFAHGFQLIMPPIAEYQESLAQGGRDLDRRMIKVVDHLSGRMLGLRPDITPQAARIDAHVLAQAGVTRLCYSDRVLHAHPTSPFGEREPLHIGAEIYGELHVNADAEAIRLLSHTLISCGLQNYCIEVHHMGLIRQLAVVSGLANLANWQSLQEQYLQALQTKDKNSLQKMLEDGGIDKYWQQLFAQFMDLFGDVQVLTAAAKLFLNQPLLLKFIDELFMLSQDLSQGVTPIPLNFDLSDGRGYHYHTGIMFSAYLPSWPQALAHGGRYDGFGERFGRIRPATGFTLDLFETYRCAQKELGEDINNDIPYQNKIFADKALLTHFGADAHIDACRKKGMAIVLASCLPNKTMKEMAIHHGCNAWLEREPDGWTIKH